MKVELEGVGTLEFPDDTKQEVIDMTVRRLVDQGRSRPGPKANLEPNAAVNALLRQFGNVQRGGIDVLGGGAQFLARGANAAGLVPESNPGGMFAGPKDVEAQNAQARANVDRWTGQEAPGFNPTRMAAGAALTMPLAPVKYLQAPTTLGRAGGAGVAGGVAGAVQEVPEPKDAGDFWRKKALQVTAGAGAGALTQPIAEWVVGKVVSGLNLGADKAVAGARELSGANSMQKVVDMTRAALKQAGMSFDDLGEAAKAGLLDDVQKALASYSGTNPGAIARQAAFREEGFDPLRHWVTRDPGEFTAIENLSHTATGNPLKQKKADLDQFAMDRLTGMRGAPPSAEGAGQAGSRDLKGWLGQERGKTNVLYDTFKDMAPNVTGQPQRFVGDLFGNLEGKMALGSLPPGLTNIVNGISKGEIPLTPSTLYQLQKMANSSRGADGSTNYALGHLSRAIDRELGAISQDVSGNTQVADVLKMARGQHAKVAGELDNSKLLRGVDEGALAPENFGDVLMGSSLKDLRSTWGKLADDTKAQVRAEVLEGLKRRTFGGASEQSGKPASQASLNNYISDATNEEKLRVVLGNEQFAALKRTALMLESAHMQPSGSAVNNSKTGGALLTALPKLAEGMKAKGVPGSSFVNDLAAKDMVQGAQSVPPGALGSRSLVIDPMVEEILRRRAGHAASLLSGSGASALYGLLGPSR